MIYALPLTFIAPQTASTTCFLSFSPLPPHSKAFSSFLFFSFLLWLIFLLRDISRQKIQGPLPTAIGNLTALNFLYERYLPFRMYFLWGFNGFFSLSLCFLGSFVRILLHHSPQKLAFSLNSLSCSPFPWATTFFFFLSIFLLFLVYLYSQMLQQPIFWPFFYKNWLSNIY